MTQTQTMNAPQRRKIELNQRQKILLIGMLLSIVIFGVIGSAYGFIGNEDGSEIAKSDNSTIQMPLAEANNKPIEDIEKRGSSLDELNPTSVSRGNPMAMEGGFNPSSGASLPNPLNSGNVLTGNDRPAGPQANDYNREQEIGIQRKFDAIERASANGIDRQAYGYNGSNNTTKKTRTAMNNETLAYVNKNTETNNSLINDIYSGKPTADYQQKLNQDASVKNERQSRQDKYDDMLLKIVENENKRREGGTTTLADNPFTPVVGNTSNQEVPTSKNNKTNQAPAFTKNRRPTTISVSKTEEENFEAALNGVPPSSGTLIKSDVGFPQIVSTNSENAFFGLNGKRTEVNKKRGRYETVEGVIHGSGDGVTVSNGSTIKIRIIAETKLQLQGEELILQPNTLITGVCAISGDRVNIKVNSLRIDNFLYPVTMLVYDLDGQQGIYVKDLAQKTQLNSALVQSAGQTLQPSYFVGQGSVGNQVGTQLITSTLQNASNVGRNLLTTKIVQVKAFVRPNYRVLLKFQEVNNNN